VSISKPKVPRALVIHQNKLDRMDRENAEFDRAVKNLRRRKAYKKKL